MTKISLKSHQFYLEKQEKEIEEAFNTVFILNNLPKDNSEITFHQLGEVFYCLNIFKESFQDIGILLKDSERSNKQNKPEFKVKKHLEMRKNKETSFLKQLWISVNPDNSTCRVEIMKNYINLLFTPNIDTSTEIMKTFIQQIKSMYLEDIEEIINPITLKPIEDHNEIWSVEKITHEFVELKKNILAYKGLKHLKPQSNKLIEKAQKEMTFKPNISKYNFSNNNYVNDFETRIKNYQTQRNENIKKLREEAELSVRIFIIYSKCKSAVLNPLLIEANYLKLVRNQKMKV